MSCCTCGNVDGRAVRNETCPVHGVYPCKPKSPDSGARECDRLRRENKQLKDRITFESKTAMKIIADMEDEIVKLRKWREAGKAVLQVIGDDYGRSNAFSALRDCEREGRE